MDFTEAGGSGNVVFGRYFERPSRFMLQASMNFFNGNHGFCPPENREDRNSRGPRNRTGTREGSSSP